MDKLMEKEVSALLDALADLREKADVNACFGEPVTAGDRTVIPVAGVAYGFAMGIGSEPTTAEEPGETTGDEVDVGSGGGGGLLARPLAVVEVTPAGTQVKGIIDERKLTLARALLIGWTVFWTTLALARIFAPKES